MGKALYFLGTQLYFLGIRIASLFNKKAKMAIAGRRQPLPEGPFDIWVHCASLGEFEQGRPVIEGLKKQRPELRILLTFFSPSGYEIRKDYSGADAVCYLPFDSPKKARRFIRKIQPSLAIFIKYEFWFYYLDELEKRNIPAVLASAIFRKEQVFFQWYGGFFRRILEKFTYSYVQNSESAALLKNIGIHTCTVAGDTRIDRVAELPNLTKELAAVEKFAERRPVLVCGSTWPPDEKILLPFINSQKYRDWKFILAPHDVQESRLREVEQKLSVPAARFSALENGTATDATVLIVDNIGTLASLYRFGRIAYIGGAFGKGLHNTLEPMAFGLPVIFGPRFRKFEEALFMQENGGGFPIKSPLDFENAFSKLMNNEQHKLASAVVKNYISKNTGATEVVVAGCVRIFVRKKMG